MPGKTNIAIAMVGIVVVLALAVVLLSSKPAPIHSATTQSYASMQLTDPPQVPNGTTALTVWYSSLAVHTTGGGWIQSNTTGSVNLMTLINTSQVLANINVSTGATIDMARFYVSKSQITINGTTYNVTVPSGQITTQLATPSTVNGVTSVLVQLSPIVVTIYTNTTPTFVLVPSVKAVAIGNTSSTMPPSVGARASLSAHERGDLEATTPNITITNVSIAKVNGSTDISVTVKDNSNTTATLRHLSVRGAENVSINASTASGIANSIVNRTEQLLSQIQNESEHDNASVNASTSVNIGGKDGSGNDVQTNANGSASSHMDSSANMSAIGEHSREIADMSGNSGIDAFVTAAVTNGTVNTTTFRTALIQKVRESLSMNMNSSEDFQDSNRVLQFQMMSNGTLMLPFSADQFTGPFGYNLTSGQSHTFIFSGPITLGEHMQLQVSLVPGSNYDVVVQGQEGARASANVTAT